MKILIIDLLKLICDRYIVIFIDATKYIADKWINSIKWSNEKLNATTNFISLLVGEFFIYFNWVFDGVHQLEVESRFFIAILSLLLIIVFYKRSVNTLRLRNDELLNSLEIQHTERVCCICRVQNSTVVLMPCAHLCLCLDCFHLHKENAVRSNHDKLCPICRHLIQSEIRIY